MPPFTRERCETDQRGAVVIITSKESRLIEAAAPQDVAGVRDTVIDHLTETELQTLRAISEKVRARLAALDQRNKELHAGQDRPE